MANIGDTSMVPRHLTYAKSNVPLIGALLDYMETSLEYLRGKTFAGAERLHIKATKASLSATFVATVCLLLGLACNVKFEVATFEDDPLPNDLHFMLMSKDDNLYVDDIDVSKVLWCIEASDALVILISSLLIWNSSNVGAIDAYTRANYSALHLDCERSPLCEYLFLPWLGATLRGLFLRQAPTAAALIYTIAVINGNVNPLFLTAFTFLFLLEARLWLEIARLVRMRWERRENLEDPPNSTTEVQTLWSNDDAQSVEVGNYIY